MPTRPASVITLLRSNINARNHKFAAIDLWSRESVQKLHELSEAGLKHCFPNSSDADIRIFKESDL